MVGIPKTRIGTFVLSVVLLSSLFSQPIVYAQEHEQIGIVSSEGALPLSIATTEYRIQSIYSAVLSRDPVYWDRAAAIQLASLFGLGVLTFIGETFAGITPAGVLVSKTTGVVKKALQAEDVVRGGLYEKSQLIKAIATLHQKYPYITSTLISASTAAVVSTFTRAAIKTVSGNPELYVPPQVVNTANKDIVDTVTELHTKLSSIDIPPDVREIIDNEYSEVVRTCTPISEATYVLQNAAGMFTLGVLDAVFTAMEMTPFDHFEKCYRTALDYIDTVKDVIPPEILYSLDNPEKLQPYLITRDLDDIKRQILIAGPGDLAQVIDSLPPEHLQETLKDPVVQQKVLSQIDKLPPELQEKIYKVLETIEDELRLPPEEIQKINQISNYLNILLNYVPPEVASQLRTIYEEHVKKWEMEGLDEDSYRELLSLILVSIVEKYARYVTVLERISPDAADKLEEIIYDISSVDPTDQEKILQLVREAEDIVRVVDQIINKDVKKIDEDITKIHHKILSILNVYSDDTLRTELEYYLSSYQDVKTKIIQNPDEVYKYADRLLEIKRALLRIYNKLIEKVHEDPSKVLEVEYKRTIDNVLLLNGRVYATITYTVTDAKLKVDLPNDVELPVLYIPVQDGKVVKTTGVLRFAQKGDYIVVYVSPGALRTTSVLPSITLEEEIGEYDVRYDIKTITSNYAVVGIHLNVHNIRKTIGSVDFILRLPLRVDYADSKAVKVLQDGRAVIVDRVYFEEGGKISKEYVVRTPDITAKILSYNPIGQREGYKVYSIVLQIENNAQEDFKNVQVTIPISIEETDTLVRVVILTPEGTRQFINDPLALIYGIQLKIDLLPAGTSQKYTILYYTQPWGDAAMEMIESAQTRYNSLNKKVMELRELGYVVPRDLDKMLQDLSSKLETMKYAANSKDRQLFEKTLREFNNLYEEALKEYTDVEYRLLSDRDYATRVFERASNILEEISMYLSSEGLRQYDPKKYAQLHSEYMNLLNLKEQLGAKLDNQQYREARKIAQILDSKISTLKTDIETTIDTLLTLRQAQVQAKMLKLLRVVDEFKGTSIESQIASIYSELKVLSESFVASINSKNTLDEKLSYIESVERRLDGLEFSIKTTISSILPSMIEEVEDLYRSKDKMVSDFKIVIDKARNLPDIPPEQLNKALEVYKRYKNLLDKAKKQIELAKAKKEKDPITAMMALLSAKDYLEDIDEEGPYADLSRMIYSTKRVAYETYNTIKDTLKALKVRYSQYAHKLPEEARLELEQQFNYAEDILERAKELLDKGEYAKALSILQDLQTTHITTLSMMLSANIQNIENTKNTLQYVILILVGIGGIVALGLRKNMGKIKEYISKFKEFKKGPDNDDILNNVKETSLVPETTRSWRREEIRGEPFIETPSISRQHPQSSIRSATEQAEQKKEDKHEKRDGDKRTLSFGSR